MLDLKLANGHFRTMDPRHPVAYQLGVWQGRIVGLDEAITDLPARRELDLGGATVLPGFVDAHVHLAWAGLKSRTPTVAPRSSPSSGGAAAASDPDGWVDIAGYDQLPRFAALDAAAVDRPRGGDERASRAARVHPGAPRTSAAGTTYSAA